MRLKLLIAAAAILGVLVIWQLMRPGPPPVDQLDARMENLRLAGDVEALASEAESTDIPTARRAVETLGYLGPEALPQLRRALEDRRPQIRQKAAIACARAADPKVAAPLLAKVARTDKSPVVRAAAVTGLGRARAYDEMETLLAEMNDDDVIVRGRAAEAVVNIIGRRYPYNLNAPPAKRLESIARIRKFWARAKGAVGEYYDKVRKRRKDAKTGNR
ncbi:MAG: HEAT repeat domain-containing protein [Phycisphaerae bacterium]|nr:HEAT repeat domain-containing protein [Phycisphaerae bacterium]